MLRQRFSYSRHDRPSDGLGFVTYSSAGERLVPHESVDGLYRVFRRGVVLRRRVARRRFDAFNDEGIGGGGPSSYHSGASFFPADSATFCR